MNQSVNRPRQESGETEVRVLGEVTTLMLQRFAIATGDNNPVYFDDAYARSCGYEGIIAPPTFIPAVLGWDAGPQETQLQADGTDAALVHPTIQGRRLMGGGQSLNFERPARPGDVITAERRVVDVYDKVREKVTLTFVVTETRYSNQRREVLLTCRDTLIALA